MARAISPRLLLLSNYFFSVELLWSGVRVEMAIRTNVEIVVTGVALYIFVMRSTSVSPSVVKVLSISSPLAISRQRGLSFSCFFLV